MCGPELGNLMENNNWYVDQIVALLIFFGYFHIHFYSESRHNFSDKLEFLGFAYDLFTEFFTSTIGSGR